MTYEKPWLICEGSADGKHVPDGLSATQAEDSPFVIDFRCKHCDWTGSVAVDPAKVSWE
jgi:hypothetical protein